MSLFSAQKLLFCFLFSFVFTLFLRAETIVLRMTPGEDGGKIYCYLYDEKRKNSFPTKPGKAKVRVVAKVSRKDYVKDKEEVVKGREMECRFDRVSKGLYAVSGYHDNKEANDKLDTNWFGYPTEGYLASNDAKITIRAPKFEEAQFKVEKGGKKLKVKIRY